MKDFECAMEQLITRAAASGEWDDALLSHVASCAACGEVSQAAAWMRELAHVPAAQHPLPNAAYVWWKAQLLEQQSAEERAMRPLLLAQVLAYIAVAVCVLLWTISKAQALQHWLATSNALPLKSSRAILPLVMLALTLLCATMILALRAILTED